MKHLSFIIIFVIILILPTYADNYSFEEDFIHKEKMEILEDALNYDLITRGMMCSLISKLIEPNSDLIENYKSVQSDFIDVPTENPYNKYIVYLSNLSISEFKIIEGDGNSCFRPNDECTYEEALKIIFSSIGWNINANSTFYGGYPIGYIKIAKEIGVYVQEGNTKERVLNTLLYSLFVPQLVYKDNQVGGPHYVYGKSLIEDKFLMHWTLGNVNNNIIVTVDGDTININSNENTNDGSALIVWKDGSKDKIIYYLNTQQYNDFSLIRNNGIVG